jgi:hypothetical protein
MNWTIIGTIFVTLLGSTATAAVVSGFVTWKVNTSTLALQAKSLEQQRLTQNLTLLSDFMAIGHGRDPRGVRASVGLGEVLGSIEAVAQLGLSYQPLRSAAKAYLESIRDSYSERLLSLDPAEQATYRAANRAVNRF